MKELRAILVDDELSSLQSLQIELKQYCPNVIVVSTHRDPREALTAIAGSRPDLVFLDIQMPHMSGFRLLEECKEIDFDVIFITAYDEYALRAFDFNATDYLLKPIMKSKLVNAVEKVINNRNRGIQADVLKALIHNVSTTSKKGLERIALPTSEGFELVHINDILYFKAERNYTWIHLQDGKKHLVAKTLKQFSNFLDYPQLFRTHHSWIVNLNHVKKYVRGQGGHLILLDGLTIPVSRANKEALMTLLRV